MTPPPKPEKNELLSAFDSVVERERERARTSAATSGPRRTRRAVVALCIVAWGALGYTWTARPEWLFPGDPGLSRPAAEREATLRFGMYLERERVLDYFEKHRRLPMSLSEAGDVEEGVEYEILGDSSFVLVGAVGATTLRLSSSDNVQVFLESTGMKPAPRGQ